MFSQFLKSAITFFTSSSTTASSTLKSEGEQQLQVELAEAAGRTMVSPRSQDHELSSNDMQGKSANKSQPVLNKKRKENQSTSITPNKAAAKRQRKGSVTEAIVTETVVTVDDGANDHATIPSTQSSQLSFHLNQPQGGEATEQAVLSSDHTATNGPSSSGKFSHVAISMTSTDGSVSNDVDKLSRNVKVPKKRRKPQNSNPADELPATESTSNPPKATHKKFGSEELIPPSTNTKVPSTTTSSQPNLEADNDAESSDEAPETVTVSAGQNQARAAASAAAEVARK